MQNIFRKECPQCAKANDVSAVHCACGYCFDPDALSGTDAATYEEEQRRLYQDYLEARLVQAEADAIAHREEANADPANTLKRAQALRAEQELNSLRAEFEQWGAPAPSTKPVKTHVAPRTTESSPRVNRQPAPIEKPTAPVTPAVSAVPEIPTLHETIEVTAPPTTIVTPARITQSTPASTPVKGEQVVSVTPITSAPKMLAPVHTTAASATSTTIPSDSFRRLQAAKAAAAVGAAPATQRFKRAIPKTETPNISAMPARQVAATPKPTPIARQECPVCTASVPGDAPRCGCGFVFESRSTEMPSITLGGAVTAAPTAPVETKQECPNCTASLPVSADRCGCGYLLKASGSEMPSVALDPGTLAILTSGVRRN